MNTDEKIKLAMDMCEFKYARNRKVQFHYIYPFTTENIAGYMPYFDFDNKSLLTVGSSSDQLLNAVYLGCNEATVIDLCPFAKEYYYLKKALIMSLSRDNYLKFLSSRQGIKTHRNCFNKKTYDKLYNYLIYYDSDIAYFWNTLFKKYPGMIIRNNMFLDDEYKITVLESVNNYLVSDFDYDSLRKKIDNVNVNFETVDIFGYLITSKYDNINLSNIGTRYSVLELKKLFDRLKNNLNDGGNILISYLYDTDVNEELSCNENSIYNMEHTKAIFPSSVRYIKVSGILGLSIDDKSMKDSVMVYKKVKK